MWVTNAVNAWKKPVYSYLILYLTYTYILFTFPEWVVLFHLYLDTARLPFRVARIFILLQFIGEVNYNRYRNVSW